MASLLRWALDNEGELVFINNVANGLACNCVCPHCKSRLIARNGGEKREAHFAHEKGSDCGEGYETALHLLAKEIISKEKKIMCPTYKGLDIPLTNQCTFQSVEVEERNDSNDLQPDCVGVTEDGMRIHIEIFVTHRVDDEKMAKLKKENLNCMEINISRDFPDDIELLTDYLLNKQEKRNWINFPYGEMIWKEEEKKRKILEEEEKRRIEEEKRLKEEQRKLEEEQRKLEEDRKKREEIEEYRKKYPDYKYYRFDKCYCCRTFREEIIKAYQKRIETYKDLLFPWAVPFTKMTIEQLSKDYLKRKKEIERELEKSSKSSSRNDNYERMYVSTSHFFDNLDILFDMYNHTESYRNHCWHRKNNTEYQGISYVFCNKEHTKTIPEDHIEKVIMLYGFYGIEPEKTVNIK